MNYTAEISISSRIALGGKCAVDVISDDGTEELKPTETTLPVDGDYTREQVTDAAEDILTANGWKVTGDWTDGDDSYYVTVDRT